MPLTSFFFAIGSSYAINCLRQAYKQVHSVQASSPTDCPRETTGMPCKQGLALVYWLCCLWAKKLALRTPSK
jgi:hypothetical protein